MKSRHATALGFCETHDKLLYTSRKKARNVARQHTKHMSVYQCSVTTHLWHVGSLALTVIQGEADRRTIYGKAA